MRFAILDVGAERTRSVHEAKPVALHRVGKHITAMGQTVPVQLVVEDAVVRGTVSVPMMLKMMSGPISDFVKTSAQKMLAKPA